MTEDAYAFVSGPTMVAEFTGVAVDNDELGGAGVARPLHRRGDLVVPDLEPALSRSSTC